MSNSHRCESSCMSCVGHKQSVLARSRPQFAHVQDGVVLSVIGLFGARLQRRLGRRYACAARHVFLAAYECIRYFGNGRHHLQNWFPLQRNHFVTGCCPCLRRCLCRILCRADCRRRRLRPTGPSRQAVQLWGFVFVIASCKHGKTRK